MSKKIFFLIFRILFDEVQVKRKYQTLLTAFRTTKRHNNRSGNNHQNFKFYDIFEELCGGDANVEPVRAVSSLKPVSNIGSSDAVEENLLEHVIDENVMTKKNCNASIKKTRSDKDEFIDFVDKKYESLQNTMTATSQAMIQSMSQIFLTLADKLISHN